MLSISSLIKVPYLFRKRYDNSEIKFQNYHNASYCKDTVHFSGKPEQAKEIPPEDNTPPVVPVEEMRKLFIEADKENRKTQDKQVKDLIMTKTFQESNRIFDDFLTDDNIDKLTEEQQKKLFDIIHTAKTTHFQKIFNLLDADEVLPVNYDNIFVKELSNILLDFQRFQDVINNPKPSPKAPQDST